MSVTLRPLVPRDAAVLADWGSDPEYVARAGWTPRTYLGYLQFWRGRIERPPDGLVRLAAVEGDVLIGYGDLVGDDPGWRELGYAVGPRAGWGRGLGTELARLTTSYGFDVLGLAEVRAEAYAANEPSVRILQRLGMTETDRGGDSELLGEATYLRRFAVTRDAWSGRV